MPELPDVELYLHALRPRIVGQRLERIRLATPFLLRTVDPPISAVAGRSVRDLRRIGKRVVWALDDDLFVVIHLMIAGRFRWLDPGAAIPRKVGLAAFDFTNGKPVGRDLAQTGLMPAGYDHNFVVNGDPGQLRPVARLKDPKTGRVMTLTADQPGVQFYTGNFLDGTAKGKGGAVYKKHAGFCLEAQHFPDSPNQPSFPTTVLKPGETYKSTTVHRFSVEK